MSGTNFFFHLHPYPIHNGSKFHISLPLRNSFFHRIPAADPLDAIVSPAAFHNGSISRDSLPLRKPCFAISFAIAHVNDTVVPPSLFGSYHNGTDYLIFLPLWNSFFRRIPAADPLDAIVSPVLFHNGSISRNSLPLREPCFAISFAIAHVNDTVVPPSLFDSFRNGTDSRISLQSW